MNKTVTHITGLLCYLWYQLTKIIAPGEVSDSEQKPGYKLHPPSWNPGGIQQNSPSDL